MFIREHLCSAVPIKNAVAAATLAAALLLAHDALAVMHPGLGRFLQRDPVGTAIEPAARVHGQPTATHHRAFPDGMNAYTSYAPLHGRLDPSGLQTQSPQGPWSAAGDPWLEFEERQVLYEPGKHPDFMPWRHIPPRFEIVSWQVHASVQVSIDVLIVGGDPDGGTLVKWREHRWLWPTKAIVEDGLRGPNGVWRGRGVACRHWVRCHQKCRCSEAKKEVDWVPQATYDLGWGLGRAGLTFTGRNFLPGGLVWDPLRHRPDCAPSIALGRAAKLMCEKDALEKCNE